MRWRRELNPVNLVLLAGIALVLLALIQVWSGTGMPSRSLVAKGIEVPMAPILRDNQPLSAFGIVAGKNLFSQDRTGPALGSAKGQNTLEGRNLLGIMIIGDTRAALIGGKPPASGKGKPEVEIVYLGEEWGGFKIIEISVDSVVFQGKDGRRTLNFPESKF